MADGVLRRQLTMQRPTLDGLASPAAPEGYRLRRWRDGDEVAVAELFNEAFAGPWTPRGVLEHLPHCEGIEPQGIFVAETPAGEVAGTATAWLARPDAPQDTGYLHRVAVWQRHGGCGLGTLLSLAALRHMARADRRRALLNTDDFRLPAIAVYLKLGFLPIEDDDEMCRRWQAVRRALSLPRSS